MEMAVDDAAVAARAMTLRQARGPLPRARRLRRRGRGRIDRLEPRPARPHPRPGAQDALGRPAPPHRARPHPVLRRGHDDPRRADQPPRRRLGRLAARVPQGLPGRRHRDQPRRRPRAGRQQGLLPRRQPPGHRHLQHGLEALPAPARGRRGAPQEGARQRREEGDHAAAAGRPLRREGVEGRRRAPDGRPRREDARRPRRGARRRPGRQAALPEPAPCGKTPLTASNLSKSYGSLEIFTAVDLAIDRGSKVVVLGLNGAGKTTLLRMLAGVDQPDTGVRSSPGTACGSATTRRSTRRSTSSARVLENMVASSPNLTETEARKVLGSFLFTGDDGHKPAGVLSGGEKTRLALAMIVVSGANVLLLDEPTNNLDPASRAGDPGRARELLGRRRAGLARRGRRRGAQPRARPDPARRRRGPLEPRLRGPDRARLSRRDALSGRRVEEARPRRRCRRCVSRFGRFGSRGAAVVVRRRRMPGRSLALTATAQASPAKPACRRRSTAGRTRGADPRRGRLARRQRHVGDAGSSMPRSAVRAGVGRLADEFGDSLEMDGRELPRERAPGMRASPGLSRATTSTSPPGEAAARHSEHPAIPRRASRDRRRRRCRRRAGTA